MSRLTLGYRPVVMVGMPSATGFPYPEVLLNIFNQSCIDEVDLLFSKDCILERMPVQNARNKIVKNFITTKATHLWFVDDDNPPSLDTLENLLRADKDIVTALIPLRTVDHLNVFESEWVHKDSFDPEKWEFQRIANCGTGCVLIKRDVLEKTYKETDGFPFQFEFKKMACTLDWRVEEYHGQDIYDKKWKDKYVQEEGKIALKNQYTSEDIFFGRVAKSLGFEHWVSIYSTCYHFTGDSWVKRIDKRSVYHSPDA